MKYRIIKTAEFEKWLLKQPEKTQAVIDSRFDFICAGHFGNHKRFDGLVELRWRNGNRIYIFLWINFIIVALYGGNKNGQNYDIRKAKKIKKEILHGTYSFFK